MASEPKRRLLSRPSAPNAHWDPDPPTEGALDAAIEYFSQQLALTLHNRGINAKALAQSLGGTQSAWRHKLNGTRLYTLEDAIGAALAFGIALPDPLWRPQAGPDALLPPPYRVRMRPRAGRIPALSNSPNWQGIADAMDTWFANEQEHGRNAAIAPPTAVHQFLISADPLGLPSSQADIDIGDTAQERHAVCTWAAKSTRTTIMWEHPFADGPSTQRALSILLHALLDTPRAHEAAHVAVVLASPTTSANLQALFDDTVGAFLSGSELKAAGQVSDLSTSTTTLELLATGHLICIFKLR